MFNISAINVNITTIATDGFALQGLFLNRNSNCKMSIEEVISLNLLSNSPLEWNVVTEKVTKTAKRRGAVMEFEMSKMPLTPLKAFTWVGDLRRKLCV